MTKGQSNPSFLFAGACLLGAGLFVGGAVLRDRTDALVRVTRHADFGEGLVASREQGATPISLGDFYAAMTDLLKHEYVEPIRDDETLATGAVRGMVLSLGDPRCVFMDAHEFRAFLNAREGRYEGIGAEFELKGTATAPKRVRPGTDEPLDDPREAVLAGHVPYLAVSMVVPGGPADRAGVKAGDIVSDINGHWLVDDAEITRFNQARSAFAAHQIPFATVSKMQQTLKGKLERSLMPGKAKDRLALGTSGAVDVVWSRAGVSRATKIAKAASTLTTFGIKDGALVLRFDAAAPGRLRAAIQGKSAVTLDLRDNVDGDFESMRKCLAVVAPAGAYGTLVSERHVAATKLALSEGNAHPPQLTVRVDRTTNGPAAIFCRALASRRRATLVGGPTGADLSVREVVELPDGTGYTLATGEYHSGDLGSTKVALAENRP